MDEILGQIQDVANELSGYVDEPPECFTDMFDLANNLYNLSATLQQIQSELEDLALETEEKSNNEI